MPDEKLRVTITADDKASPVVSLFSRNVRSLDGSARRAGSSIGGLNERAKGLSQFSESLALPRIGAGIKNIGMEGQGAFRSLGFLGVALKGIAELLGPLGLGTGAMLGLGAAGAKMSKDWANGGLGLGIAAKNIGITTGQLFRLQRMGAMAGVPVNTMTGGLLSLQTALYMGRINNDPKVMNALRLLGIHAFTATGRIRPLTQILPQLSAALSRVKAGPMQLQALQALGIDPQMIAFLRKGPAWMAAQNAALEKEGANSKLFMGSAKLYSDFSKLDTATMILTDRIGRGLAPVVDKAVVGLTRFVDVLSHFLNWIPKPAGPGESPAARQGPRGIRDNNPLNLHFAGQKGAIGKDGSFARFGTRDQGIAAATRQLLLYNSRGLNTVQSIVGRWAPAKAGNNTAAYIGNVAGRMGISPTARLNLTDPAVMTALVGAMAFQETGQAFIPNIRKGVDEGFRESKVTIDINHNNVPPGVSTHVSTSDSGAALGRLKISHAMSGGTN